ncbi:MAG: hydantoinase/oxoprolinase family protein [Deltaproteobacteria bacterium]|nr:hydantoinase/oxoprolinase family protein [Deltaproteobacteria bacterium]
MEEKPPIDRARWRIGIDVGGTFTDFLAIGPDGRVHVHKTLSTPDDPSRALIDGLGELAAALGHAPCAFLPAIGMVVHGTTVTTNAALTRSGAHTGLLTTAGVRDALQMRRGVRERQYDNRYTNVEPLVPRHLRLDLPGRLDRDGCELEPLDPVATGAAIDALVAAGCEAVAVCLMHAYANADHERALAQEVRQRVPRAYVSVSSELLPAVRFYDRLSTTALNAYVGPKLRDYIDALLKKLAAAQFGGVLRIMQSNGGVVAPEVVRERAAMTLLSGPAAGPRAGAFYIAAHGIADAITVDMGGTSFDAALLLGGDPLFVTEGEIDRLRLALPMLDIATIGAGGGSIGWIDAGGLLRMGPQSAGAAPGPACYGRGGSLPTCTDADLVLGYLPPAEFAGGRLPLDMDAARVAIGRDIAAPLGLSVETAAAGMARVIDANMAMGVRSVSVRRGIDPRELVLVVAGGAGPQHCAAICDELEMPVFLVPRQSSIFCAAGMLMSDLVHDDVASLPGRLDQLDPAVVAQRLADLVARGNDMLGQEHVAPEDRVFVPSLDLRYVKQYHEVNVACDPCGAAVADLFHAAHDRLYGYHLRDQGTPIEVLHLRLRAIGRVPRPRFPALDRSTGDANQARLGTRRAWVPERSAFEDVAVFDGDRLMPGAVLPGPVLVDQRTTTLFAGAAWTVAVDGQGHFIGYRADARDRLPAALREVCP